ncbi:MAG: TolC family protein [Desulfobacterales bacterium]|nr:TolC family protein [Desulfobacterales bacterium]
MRSEWVIPFVLASILVLVLFLMPGTEKTWAGTGTGTGTADTGTATPAMEMTLSEAVLTALRTNRTVKSTFLDRVVQKFDLRVEQDKFNTDVDFSADAGYTGSETHTKGSGKSTSTDFTLSNTLTASKAFETGASLEFSWDRDDDLSDTNDSAQDRSAVNTWSVDLSQPLLQGAGIAVNTASVVLAEMSEQSNLLSHRDTIISTVNSVISAFRAYAQNIRQLDIIKASLQRSRDTLEMNRIMVAMGRTPANEIISAESDVANQEFSYETALNDVDSSRISLLKVLDLPRETRISPVEETDLTEVHPNFDTCLATAFNHRSDMLNALMNLERARIDVVLAEDNDKWNLDFTAGVSATDSNYRMSDNSDDYDWSVGLSLTIPIYGDLTREQTLLTAGTTLKKARLELEETRQNITLEVQDGIREVETRLKQVTLAERARELAEQKLAVETEKLRVGRTTNFQVVTYQNDLVDSQNAEVNARVDYLNALTDLDTVLGTTLDTWKIDYNRENDKWPGK